jgi:ABC-2 type transport system ATP-binding protein
MMGLPARRVAEMLELVGLTDTEANRRVGNYSLGMRQRLGIAAALIGEPEVLVLDEPANGLDPAGIRWMRRLLKSYADQGGTVLLSSHLLNEVELIADEMILIGRGAIVASGTKESLLSGQTSSTLVHSEDNDALGRHLTAAGHTVTTEGGGLRVDCDSPAVGRAALEAQVVLTELRSGADGLEDLFLSLTGDTQREGHPAAATAQGGTA